MEPRSPTGGTYYNSRNAGGGFLARCQSKEETTMVLSDEVRVTLAAVYGS
jgi:hypothetical protein